MTQNQSVQQHSTIAAEHNRQTAEFLQGIQIMLRNSVAAFTIGRKVSRCGSLAMAQDVSQRLAYGLSMRWLEFDPSPATGDLL